MQNIKLLKKLAMLSVLLSVFGYLAFFDTRTVNALPCCRDCFGERQACVANCFNIYIGGSEETEQGLINYYACVASCHQMATVCEGIQCTSTCEGGCTLSSECGDPNCICTQEGCLCF